MPKLCLIKELKSNLDAQWNHRGDKICVGASSGHMYVGTYDETQGFWVIQQYAENQSKPLHKASVVAVSFDPGSGHVVASASADGRVEITSCYDQQIDSKSKASGPFAGVTSDTERLFKFDNDAWVNTVCFSPSGQWLAFASKFE